MTFRTLIGRSLRFHARSHFGVVLGAAIGSAALTGALLVGDSMRESLREKALSRLGPVWFALSTLDRLFLEDLGERVGTDPATGGAWLGKRCPVLLLPGTAVCQDGRARANNINVLGVPADAWPRFAGWSGFAQPELLALRSQTGLSESLLSRWKSGEVILVNDRLARQLSLKEGDEIIVRVQKPTALALDAVMSPREDQAVALRITVGPILPARLLGDFSLSASQIAPGNAFVPLHLLQQKTAMRGHANLVVNGMVESARKLGWTDRQRLNLSNWLLRNGWFRQWNPFRRMWIAPDLIKTASLGKALEWFQEGVQHGWRLEDAQLNFRVIEPAAPTNGGELVPSAVELTSERIFLEPQIVSAALTAQTRVVTSPGYQGDDTNVLPVFFNNGVGVLTYLANLIHAGDRATPYSMVTAAGGEFVPADMRDDEMLANEWLAEDLHVKPGDSVAVSYYIADSGSRLLQRTNSFTVRGVVPLKGRYADRTLMPEFPGLAKAESTHDWDAGFPLVYKIRDKDEAYWKQYRGTPKAFITLAAGQAMWTNRFGSLTAIRYEVPTNSFARVYRETVYTNLLANLDPAQLGLRFEPVREQALRAAEQSQDFGQLFLGFSFFLVIAALLLMALLFQFGLEQRAAEVGTFLALGFTARQVRRLLLLEGAALALLGGILGTAGGLGYAKAMLWALTTIWRSAVGTSELHFHARAATFAIGLCASTLVAVLTIWLTLRKQARQPVRELLGGEVQSSKPKVKSRGGWIALGAGLAALAMVVWALVQGDTANAESFFSAGSLLLVAGLAAISAWLTRWARKVSSQHLTLGGLGLRGCARRRNRSLATIGLLACGAFLIIAIGVFRQDANRDAIRGSSGTGGFALLGESTLPVLQDLNTRSGREFFGLNENDLAGVNVVPFRVHQGDEASCLNLNRAQKPRLLGVNPALLATRFSFAKLVESGQHDQPWNLLRDSALRTPHSALNEVPAIGDANSIQWALGKKIGDTLDYTDEHGRTFKLRLVGAVANSILQGSLIIDEAEFVKKFPTESGYRMFLIDAPANSIAQVSATLSRALQDVGLELTPAVSRLNAFNAVQNTYLGTFQILGGLGLLLGSAGLGVVVLRNVLERRGELAVLLAVGFRRRALLRLVLYEHAALLGLGLGLGFVAAVMAVLPALSAPGHNLPVLSLVLTLGAVLLNGALWTWLATRYALRGNLLAALRNE